ncbi:MAG: glycosyltransferase [Calothrix sp. SM1_7_51]|nr:glycosyltransferase [Calothrix sp. SM1_7_51]
MSGSTAHPSPKISVIIPAYNSAKTIKETINSVLSQTFTDFELIVINDGSQDETLAIVQQITDSRLKVFSYSNQGANISRNLGFSHAIGEYISFLDADDIWTANKLELQLNALENNPEAAVAYSWTDYIDENGKIIFSGRQQTFNGNVYEQLLIGNFLENGSNPLIRKNAFIEAGKFDEQLSAGQDWDMWLRLAAKFQFVAVPQVQILYRVSANSLSTNLARQEKACVYVLNKALKSSPESLQYTKAISLTNLYKYLTWKALHYPLNRQKALAGAKFLYHYIINDKNRLQNLRLSLILSIKIAIILVFGGSFSTVLLTRK